MGSTYWQGLGIGASMIMAIGAQNAHVLRTGLQRYHVGVTVVTCVLVDILLIAVGVAGMGVLLERSPLAMQAVRWGGAAFLFWYGLRSWRAALAPQSLAASDGAAAPTLRRALVSVIGLSLLNPHVYLDTVVLLGGVGGKLPPGERIGFMLGAMSASVLWFSAIGYGARALAPLLNRPVVWRCIDVLTGCMMVWLGMRLALG
jgi:L-lysine exporter family protein LysE/ArgO